MFPTYFLAKFPCGSRDRLRFAVLILNICTHSHRRQSCLTYGCNQSSTSIHGNTSVWLAPAESKKHWRRGLLVYCSRLSLFLRYFSDSRNRDLVNFPFVVFKIYISLYKVFSIDKVRLSASLLTRRASLTENAQIAKTVFSKNPLNSLSAMNSLNPGIPLRV